MSKWDSSGMESLLKSNSFCCVIDVTHCVCYVHIVLTLERYSKSPYQDQDSHIRIGIKIEQVEKRKPFEQDADDGHHLATSGYKKIFIKKTRYFPILPNCYNTLYLGMIYIIEFGFLC